MTERSRKTIGAIGLTLGLVALMLILILTALHDVGTDGALYHRLQLTAWRTGPVDPAGISDEDLQRLDGELAKYLAGSENELLWPSESEPGTYTVMPLEIWGELKPAFNEREVAHLVDCFNLFQLLRRVRRRLVPWAVLLIVGGAYLMRDRRRARRCAWVAPLALLIPLGAFALWAAVDFDGAFTFFHRVLFTNDLWLLDPRTDLLIRICPESMFMAMGRMIALRGLIALAGVPALALALTILWPKEKKSEENRWNDNRATRRASAQRRKTFDVKGRR